MAGIDRPKAELVKDKAFPPPKTTGLLITFVFAAFIDALKAKLSCEKKFIAFETEELVLISSSGHTILAESCKIILL